MNKDRSGLSRWSQRKRAAQSAPDTPAEVLPEAEPELTEEEWLTAHEMPEPETLGEGDDFGAFLKDGVPELLRRRALRQLWKSPTRRWQISMVLWSMARTTPTPAMVPEVLNTRSTRWGKWLFDRDILKDDASGDATSDAS